MRRRAIGGNFLGPDRRAEPAHAVREPRRCKANLGMTKALPDLAKNRISRKAQALEPNDGMTANKT